MSRCISVGDGNILDIVDILRRGGAGCLDMSGHAPGCFAHCVSAFALGRRDYSKLG